MTKSILWTLAEKVDPKNAALLIIDMQNDFCSLGGTADKLGYNTSMIRGIIPRLVSFAEEARQAGLPIIHIRNVYNTKDNRYLSDVFLEQARRRRKGGYWELPFCVEGSWGWDFVDRIKPQEEDIVVTKHRFSAFINTDLDLILRSKGIRTLVLTGVNTNVCVESTARDGFMKDYYIVLVKDCTSTYSEKLYEATLENIDSLFGQVTSSEEVLNCWGPRMKMISNLES